MRFITSFESEDGWQYQVIELESLGKVQLWYLPAESSGRSQKWDLGHSKGIPAGKDAAYVAEAMRQFIVEGISCAAYGRLLGEG